MSSAVRAGFPSPADDHLDNDLELHQHVVRHPAATYFVRAEGDSMTGDGIHHGDLLVVDRSLEAMPGRVIVIAVDGDLTVKRLELVGQRAYLRASNPAYRPIPLEGRLVGVLSNNDGPCLTCVKGGGIHTVTGVVE
ncbi:LexA family protein [Vreelandella azerica]|uniref:LexA family protein n=1 Tax=Vreelandella azerica TaxID=2732867 RepID=UPI001F3EC0F1|nr:translesion error-prone DNA polymerase V autoproteolytic subunit [Halomonas azerica]